MICRTVGPKRLFTRIVRTPDEGVQIDLTGKRDGRGSYLCSDPVCWEKAVTDDRLDKTLRTKLTESERAMIVAYGMQLASRLRQSHD